MSWFDAVGAFLEPKKRLEVKRHPMQRINLNPPPVDIKFRLVHAPPVPVKKPTHIILKQGFPSRSTVMPVSRYEQIYGKKRLRVERR